jgi:hypothetical protein
MCFVVGCQIQASGRAGEYTVTCEVSTFYHTGVEMEALTGASVAALCIYDMCKALSHEIVIASKLWAPPPLVVRAGMRFAGAAAVVFTGGPHLVHPQALN